jgi:hypothetical protein
MMNQVIEYLERHSNSSVQILSRELKLPKKELNSLLYSNKKVFSKTFSDTKHPKRPHWYLLSTSNIKKPIYKPYVEVPNESKEEYLDNLQEAKEEYLDNLQESKEEVINISEKCKIQGNVENMERIMKMETIGIWFIFLLLLRYEMSNVNTYNRNSMPLMLT